MALTELKGTKGGTQVVRIERGPVRVFAQALMDGDAVYDGPLLYELPGSSIESYALTLRRLLALDVRIVHAGHDPSFGRERLRAIAEEHLRRFRA